MNSSSVIVVCLACALSFSLGIIVAPDERSYTISFETSEELSAIVDQLFEEMYARQIFLSNFDIFKLIAVDPNLYPIYLDSHESGYRGGHGIGPDYETRTVGYENGTRIYSKTSNDGMLLEHFEIHHSPESAVTIIIKP